MKKTDDKIMLVNIGFNLNACKNLSKRELGAISDTATYFFHFIQSFSNKLKLEDLQGARPRSCNVWNISDILLQ